LSYNFSCHHLIPHAKLTLCKKRLYKIPKLAHPTFTQWISASDKISFSEIESALSSGTNAERDILNYINEVLYGEK